MQQMLRISGFYHRLEIQTDALVLKGVRETLSPALTILQGTLTDTALQAQPVLALPRINACQPFIHQMQQLLNVVTRCKRHQCYPHHRLDIRSARLVQNVEIFIDLQRPLLSLINQQSAQQQGELASPYPRQQRCYQASASAALLQQSGNRTQQLVGLLTAQALIQPG